MNAPKVPQPELRSSSIAPGAPALKVEGPKDEELRIMAEPSAGGGYDPYNQHTNPPKVWTHIRRR